MKKFLIFIAMLTVLVSSLVLAVNAADPSFGTRNDDYYTVKEDGVDVKYYYKDIIPQCHMFGDEQNKTTEHKDGYFNDECARVLLKYTVNGTSVTKTYPAYYVLENNSTLTWNFAPLEECLKKTHGDDITLSVKNVIQIEIPFGITLVPRRCFVPDDCWYENGTASKPETHAVASNYLTYVELPNSLLKIDDYAFAHCTSLTTVASQTLADHEGEGEGDGPVQGNHNHLMLQYIGFRAFHDCPITDFNFNKHLVYIGEAAFEGCHLRTINLSKCVELKVIPAYCFHEAENSIEAIIMPAFLEEIGDYAFTGSSAGTIFLGMSLKKIGHNAIDMSGAEFIVLSTTLETVYKDSISFGSNSYRLAFAGAKSEADLEAPLAVLEKAGCDLKHGDKTSKIYGNSVKFFKDENFCLTYLGGHLADPESDITRIEYPYGIGHEGTAYGGACAICCVATQETTVRPILIAKGYSIREYGSIPAFTNGYEVYHNALEVYESVYGDCEIGLLFALASRYNAKYAKDGKFDLRNNISSLGAILTESQLNVSGDASMDFMMTYSKGLITPEGANRGAEPVVITAYLLHKDAEKAGDKYNTSLYVQDEDQLCVHKTFNANGEVVHDGKTNDKNDETVDANGNIVGKENGFYMVSYNSISGVAHQELLREE